MKKILLIATGGTIASSESSEGLTPSIDVKTLLTYIPELSLSVIWRAFRDEGGQYQYESEADGADCGNDSTEL